MTAILTELTQLSRTTNSKVALRARQVLIASNLPSFELRHNQVESIFLSAIDMFGHQFCPENLQKLILSETSIFDVLPNFFYHSNQIVRMAALEVYVRRAYIAYELNSLQHQQLHDGTCVVEFQFMLPSSHPNRCTEGFPLWGQLTPAWFLCLASVVYFMELMVDEGRTFPSVVQARVRHINCF
uniref:Acetyl-CoA carboxylase central domain-containing protein n=1 Tax=Eptatretus burgeri TaxID=7764 RepID=A0A8C4QDJ8_EPTBU